MDEFKNELIELMEKHKVELYDSRQYDGNGGYCGTEYRFCKVGEPYGDFLEITELQ